MLPRPRLPWSALFCATLWHIWLDWNYSLCFQQLSNLHLIPSKSFAFAAEFWFLLPHSVSKSVFSFILVKWPPPKIWMDQAKL
ncbi:hypothetical protein SLEP1_g33300 [Rubroshorea leprosula]|uniref:Secreted protein n=1 Tax=Rubroshorea leprosula TaxID=152421 RepID=A0AAV5KGD7_9ROSI|nr:hypothetical protein SLEP1_g33300 [Rubroshorea leprosula]